jgi:hypothetical protein
LQVVFDHSFEELPVWGEGEAFFLEGSSVDAAEF